MTRQAVQTLALVGLLLLGLDASVTRAQSPEPSENLWLRVMGSSGEVHVAVALSVEEASELRSAEVALDEGSAVQAMAVCPSDEDGQPDLSALQTLGTISSVASQGTHELEPGTPLFLEEGEWWLVATFEGTGQPEANVNRLGFNETEDGPRVLLGDGESPWGTVIGLVPQLTAELSPTTVSKAGHAAEGSEARAKPIVARYLGASPNPVSTGGTDFAFTIAKPGPVRLSIYDVRGRLVQEIGPIPASVGDGVLHWDGRAPNGASVASGVYHARFKGPGISGTSRLLVLK